MQTVKSRESESHHSPPSGAIVIGFGLFTIGLLQPFWTRLAIIFPGGHPIAAYALSMASASGWTHRKCASATVSKSVAFLGLVARLKSIGRAGRLLQALAGGVMIIMGTAMITGYLSIFSFWLLETFPALSTIG